MSRSEHKGFRRFLPLLSLIAVLLLAAAFVFMLPFIKQKASTDSKANYDIEPTYRTIEQLDESMLQTITITHTDGERYTLVNEDNILSLMTKTGGLESIDMLISDQMIRYATMIYVEDTITQDESEVADQLSAMGLNPPLITATAAFSDGSEITISLGNSYYDTTYHYYQWSGDAGIYLCNSGVYDTFSHTADRLRTVTQPPINASLVESVSITPRDGDPMVCSLETDDSGTLRGTLLSPFAYPMNPEATAGLLAAVENFRLGVRLESATEETLAMYGLASPQAVVTITHRGGMLSQVDENGALQSSILEPSTATFALGDADGDFFRYCLYEGTCYRVSSFLVNTFIRANVQSLATLKPADMDGDTLQDITVQTENGTLTVHADYLESVLPNNMLETDENGDIVYKVKVTCNEEPTTVEAFAGLVSRLKQMTVSGLLSGIGTPSGTPRWQLTLSTTQGRTRTLAAFTMDAFSDLLAVDGVALSYINNEALDIALGEFTALLIPADVAPE